jgi:hypothetical protein
VEWPANRHAHGSGQYDDPTAILKGSWKPDQRVTAKAFCSNDVVDHINYPEVELRLRFTISPGVAKGYEIMWRCSDSTPSSLGSSYLAVAAWLGGSGQFTGLPITLPSSSTRMRHRAPVATLAIAKLAMPKAERDQTVTKAASSAFRIAPVRRERGHAAHAKDVCERTCKMKTLVQSCRSWQGSEHPPASR